MICKGRQINRFILARHVPDLDRIRVALREELIIVGYVMVGIIVILCCIMSNPRDGLGGAIGSSLAMLLISLLPISLFVSWGEPDAWIFFAGYIALFILPVLVIMKRDERKGNELSAAGERYLEDMQKHEKYMRAQNERQAQEMPNNSSSVVSYGGYVQQRSTAFVHLSMGNNDSQTIANHGSYRGYTPQPNTEPDHLSMGDMVTLGALMFMATGDTGNKRKEHRERRVIDEINREDNDWYSRMDDSGFGDCGHDDCDSDDY